MSDITLINDSEQSSLVTNGLAKNGEMYLKKAGSTDAGSIVVYDSGAWKTFANEASAGFANAYSVDFDGTNDYVATTYKPSSSATALSISYWMKSTSYAGGVAPFSVEGYPNYEKVFRVNFNSLGNFFISVAAGGNPYNNTSNSATNTPTQGINLFDGNWHHVVGTLNGQSIKVYADGVEEFTATSTVTYAGGDQTYPYYIGMLGNGYPSYYMDGKLDEVSVFENELSASDVTAIYNSGVPASLTSYSPAGWWRMGDDDSGTGTTITDQGSGGNNGTLTNGPTFSTDVPS